MDEIKGVVGPGPFRIAVVEFKLAIGWGPGWLDRGDVGTNNFGIRKLVGEIASSGKGETSSVRPLCVSQYLRDMLIHWGQ